MTLAWGCSLLLHGAILAVAGVRYTGFGPSAVVPPEPIVVNLQPKTPAPHQLVDVLTPAAEPVKQTDLIVDVDSNAAGKNLQEGDNPGPALDKQDDFDTLAAPPAPPQPQPQPAPQSAPAPAPKEARKKTPRVPEKKQEARIVLPPSKEPPEEIAGKEPERFDLAKATPPAQPDLPKGQTKGRLHNEVKRKGFTNFEAMQDQIAPYLREIRKQVEKRWIEGLVTRYNGTQPTEAVIDCAISPEGKLISATVAKTPEDPLYAALCVQALQKAGPFGPFPFKVPDMYRNQNLEIRWTFSFL